MGIWGAIASHYGDVLEQVGFGMPLKCWPWSWLPTSNLRRLILAQLAPGCHWHFPGLICFSGKGCCDPARVPLKLKPKEDSSQSPERSWLMFAIVSRRNGKFIAFRIWDSGWSSDWRYTFGSHQWMVCRTLVLNAVAWEECTGKEKSLWQSPEYSQQPKG